MANKSTKRQRKFNASGGIQGRLKKGIQFGGNHQHGKKKRKTTTQSRDHDDTATNPSPTKQNPIEDANDLTSSENVGDLDLESFFETFDGKDNGGDDVVAAESASQKPDPTTHARPLPDDDASSDSSEEEDDEDEDIDVAQAQMQAHMKALASSDPEFHAYLKDNEQSLLEFGDDDDDDQDEGEDVDEEDVVEENDTSAKAKTEPTAIALTPELLQSLAKGAFHVHSIKKLRRIIAAYRSACYLSQTAEKSDAAGDGSHHQRYTIESSQVFNDLMILCLKQCHKEFTRHLNLDTSTDTNEDIKEKGADDDDEVGDTEQNEAAAADTVNTPLNPRALERSECWDATMRPLLQSFFRSTLQVMSEAKDASLLSFLLQALDKYLRFMSPFPRIAESMLKALAELWSAPLDSSEDYQVVRLYSFLRIRQLALTQPFPFIEECLRKTYLAYAKRAKFGNTASSQQATLTFMGNCLVELYSLDYHSSYQHAFVYIRQLALLLRTAMQKKSQEAYANIHCWQYVQCLKLWVAVLASVAAPSGGNNNGDAQMLGSLVYPLTEVILATARSSPSVRHFPLRMHCVRLLQQLAASTETFIPTSSLLLGCLEWNEWTLPPKKRANRSAAPPKAIEIAHLLQFGREDPLRSREQLDAAIQEWFRLLDREVELYRFSAGCYEYVCVLQMRVRSFVNKLRNGRWKAMGRASIEKCATVGAFCVQQRAKLATAPKDVTILECCKPEGAASMGERHAKSLLEHEKRQAEDVVLSTKGATTGASGKDEEPKAEGTKSTKNHTAKRKKQQKKEVFVAMNDTELKQHSDTVVEGVTWSDEE